MEDKQDKAYLAWVKHYHALLKSGPKLSEEDELKFISVLGWLIADHERATTELRECREEFYSYQKEHS